MAKKTKLVGMAVTVRVPKWMSAEQARRVVREAIKTEGQYIHGPMFEEGSVTPSSVRPLHALPPL